MKITVVQPSYFSENEPDKTIADFFKKQIVSIKANQLILLPEYSNAGGLLDKEREILAIHRVKDLLSFASKIAKKICVYCH